MTRPGGFGDPTIHAAALSVRRHAGAVSRSISPTARTTTTPARGAVAEITKEPSAGSTGSGSGHDTNRPGSPEGRSVEQEQSNDAVREQEGSKADTFDERVREDSMRTTSAVGRRPTARREKKRRR